MSEIKTSVQLAKERLLAATATSIPESIKPLPDIVEPSQLDIQEGGNHYKSMAIQPVQFIKANNIPFIEGNVIKYVSRHRNKNGADDIKKAIHFLNMLLEFDYPEEK
ncbi:hypothetical protein D3C87_601000 [compost metagenome]